MRRQTYGHCRKRSHRPAVFRQQIIRKEARKRAKYPLRIAYVPLVYMQRNRKRGA